MGRGSGGGSFRAAHRRRQRGNTPINNRAQNKQTDSVASKLNLTPKQARKLHDLVNHQGYGYQEILELAKEIFSKQ